jgi:hypothetical protein
LEINIKRMALEQHPRSHINTAKTNPPSLSLILDPFLSHVLIIVLVRRIVEEAAPLNVVQEDNYKDLVEEVVHVEEISLDDGVKASAVVDSAGKIMINHNVFAMQVFKSKMNGNYSRKSNSTDYPNLQ